MNGNWPDSECYEVDPLPDIEPALLNSVDIMRYVAAGCLIGEGDFDQSRVKTASYEMRFLGHLYHWEHIQNEGLRPRCEGITQDDKITIAKNSITYLWTKERLYLPEYIAARFNLHIRHVHRGILLGTGPLVDPGFGGRILIPLHNLTDKDYELVGGDGIVWVEFTKISRHGYWAPGSDEPRGDLVKFPSKKVIDHARDYFEKAEVTASGGVISAFKGALSQAEDAAKRAEREADSLKWKTWVHIVTGVVAILAILVAIWLGSINLLGRTVDRIHSTYDEGVEDRMRQDRQRIDDLTRELKEIKVELESMRKPMRGYEDAVEPKSSEGVE